MLILSTRSSPLATLVCALVAGASSSDVARAPLLSKPSKSSSRIDDLETLIRRQSLQLEMQSARIADLERTVAKEFEVMHYNVLADQAGKNMVPWFCYGADVTEEERKELHKRFYAMGDKNKRAADKGWPTWAEGILSAERIAAVEAYDARVFAWDTRKHALWHQVMTHTVGCRTRSPDIVTLAECDHFGDFWREKFESNGYATLWRKRPRRSARDGCAIAWRASTFELVAQGGFDFGAEFGAAEPDRTCAFALLRYKRDPSVRLLVATTHLERAPDDANRQITRGYQYGTIFRELLTFAGAHKAEQVPVVLTGDLNAKDCDELAGIARALVRLLRSPTHPLLWSVMDAPTPATTYTEERCMRIDYLLYQSAAVSLTGVGELPRLSAPIPDETHPSDHLPVSARLVLRSKWAQIEENAYQWLACVSGTTTVRPLSPTALRQAFEYFDKDDSGLVSHVELEAGMQTLGFPGLDTKSIRQKLLDSGCEPCQEGIHMAHVTANDRGPVPPPRSDLALAGAAASEGEASTRRDGPKGTWTDGGLGLALSSAFEQELSWAMDLESFIKVYTDAVRAGSSAMTRQIEKAFDAFDPSGIGVLAQSELRGALQRMATAPLDETRLDQVLKELAGASAEGITSPGQAAITMKSFSDWMLDTYTSYLKDPSLVVDSLDKVPVYHQ